ncbi:MAG: alcohol dehydrogenase catalytic domain-containing protein, partial [Terrimicrobiaceae bacterium]
MVFQTVGQPLLLHEVPRPVPGPGQVLVKVSACGVCRTDLHVVDGELAQPKLPLIPGHEIVGHVEATGEGAGHFEHGERVGIPCSDGRAANVSIAFTSSTGSKVGHWI